MVTFSKFSLFVMWKTRYGQIIFINKNINDSSDSENCGWVFNLYEII